MVTIEFTHNDVESKTYGNPLKEFPAYDSCYDEGVSLDDPSGSDCQLAPDPYRCTLQIRVKGQEVDALKKMYGPLLEGIDPTFQFICLNESENINSPLFMWEREYSKGGSVGQSLNCPAICVVLFLYEKFGRLSALTVQKTFNFPPWKFHHRIELPQGARPRVTARQDFYSTAPDLPLWAICPVHFGNEHLRFHLFVRNFARMKSFYEVITGAKSESKSPNFCFIPLYSQRGLDIQLSLKYLPQVSPKPTNAVRLKFKIKDISSLAPFLMSHPIPYGGSAWLTSDPDGNFIILEETEAKHSHGQLLSNPSFDTSDYDTASGISGDTESLRSFEQSPRSSVFLNNLEGTLI